MTAMFGTETRGKLINIFDAYLTSGMRLTQVSGKIINNMLESIY